MVSRWCRDSVEMVSKRCRNGVSIFCLPAKPAVIKCLREHFSRISAGRRGGRAHFVLGFAGIQHERDQHSNGSKHVQACPNLSKCIRIGPSRSQHIQNLPKTSKNLRTFSENFAKISRSPRSCCRCLSSSYSCIGSSSRPWPEGEPDGEPINLACH